MVGQFFSMLFAKLAAIITWFGKLAVAVFEALWDIVRDAACWPFEQATDIALSAVTAIDLSGLSDKVGAWGSLPAEMVNIMGLLHVGTAASIIVASIGVRLLLQLIPFTRLGS